MKKNLWGRPKKWEGEIKQTSFTLYQKEIDQISSLAKLWRLCSRTDVIRKCLDIVTKQEDDKKST